MKNFKFSKNLFLKKYIYYNKKSKNFLYKMVNKFLKFKKCLIIFVNNLLVIALNKFKQFYKYYIK